MADQCNIRCPSHRKENVLYTCTSSQCTRQSMICAACPDGHGDHAHSLVGFGEWVLKVSRSIEEGSKYQSQLKDSLQDFDQLLKWCDDDEMHLRKVEQHCQAQKALIADDLMVARDLFSDKCYSIQTAMDLQLDEFLTIYKESFKQCKQTIEDSYLLFRTYSAFSNPNNLMFKLQQSTTREAQEVTQGLKRMAHRVRQIEQDKIGFTEGLKLTSQKISYMTDNLPVYQFQEGLDHICQRLADDLQHHLHTKLKIKYYTDGYAPVIPAKENKLQKQYSQTLPNNHNRVLSKQHSMPPEYPNNSKSPKKEQAGAPANQISLTNKNLQLQGSTTLTTSDLIFKPLKKYQLDFNVSAIEVVSDTLFALACSSDPYMRMFDTVQKRIHTLQAHGNPITSILKWIEPAQSQPLGVINNGIKSPKAPYIFSLSSDAIIIWTFEMGATMSTVPHIQHKFMVPVPGSITQICCLQDAHCLMLGDREGGVEVYNYQTQRVQQACLRGKHTKSINSIVLHKRYDKVLIASADQCISVWRLLYNTHNQVSNFENAYCESVMNLGSGSISNMSQLSSNPNLVLITNSSGAISLFSLLNQQIILTSEIAKNTNQIVDYLVVEDLRKQGTHEQFCLIAQGQGTKSLRFWRVVHKDEGWNQTESRMDVAISPTDSLMCPKMQFVHMLQNSTSPLVLIANEINKELLVYEIVTK